MKKNTECISYLKEQKCPPEIIAIFEGILSGAKQMRFLLSQAAFLDLFGALGQNIQAETQQKLDEKAQIIFEEKFLATQNLAALVSEEKEEIIQMHKEANYVLVMDPLDGSSNIDVNLSVGSIFGIFKRKTLTGTEATAVDFLRKGDELVAAAYVLYGTATVLVLNVGTKTLGFTLDEKESFLLSDHFEMPAATIYSVNQANQNSWDWSILQMVEKYQKKCTARYVGALVADFHRNLIKGGVYFYPADQKAKQGKLRLLYECFPLAFLASGANGTAFSNLSPKTSILSLRAEAIHQRSPFFVFPLKNLVDLNEQ